MDRTFLTGLGVISVIIILLVGTVSAILLYGGVFQTPSTLNAKIQTAGTGCKGSITYSVELKNDNGRGIASQEIATYVNGLLFERLITDQNGRLSSTKEIPSELCGTEANITFAFAGTIFYKSSNNSTKMVFKTPTKIEIQAQNQTTSNSMAEIRTRLSNSINNSGIPNERIFLTGDAVGEAITDKYGNATFNIQLNQTGNKKIQIRFFGDKYTLPVDSETVEINVIQDICFDGTFVGQCSRQISYFCSSAKELVSDCSKCGCNAGFVCSNNTCVTQEKATVALINELQKGIVKIQHSLAGGSGIIIAHSNNQTVILTNRHVIEEAASISDVFILTNNLSEIAASDIRIAPNNMDLAIVYVNGIYGTPVKINYSGNYPQGTSVLALGSPLGLQGSVSNGIVSNFISDKTDTNYGYELIQTDAAINPGNSGGGLFEKESGELIGVNSLKAIDVGIEGLGFAINIKELQRLSNYSNWQKFNPLPRCSDGTLYNSCAASKELYCSSNGVLISACDLCGCPSDFPYCSGKGRCFTCTTGFSPFLDSNGNGFCCPAGYSAYSDSNGNGFCCAPGTKGTASGTCQAN